MNARQAQKELKKLLAARFGNLNVKTEWHSNINAKDWLQFGGIYAPRPDIAVGPFNVEEGAHISEIENTFIQNIDFFRQLEVTDSNSNVNPRCLIAFEVENSGSSKHMIGNIINASLLGKVGIIVTLRDEFYRKAERIYKYLEGTFETKKIGHNPSNVVFRRYIELKKYLL